MYPNRPPSPSAGTAKTLILVGLILQAIEVLIVLALGAVLLIVFVGVFLLLLGILGIVWLVIIYVFSYQRIGEGRYEEARAPTIVVAILSLLTLHLISGILYLIAYVKLGDAVRESQTYGGPPPGFSSPPLSASPARICLGCGRMLPSPAPAFCPSCGKQVPP